MFLISLLFQFAYLTKRVPHAERITLCVICLGTTMVWPTSVFT